MTQSPQKQSFNKYNRALASAEALAEKAARYIVAKSQGATPTELEQVFGLTKKQIAIIERTFSTKIRKGASESEILRELYKAIAKSQDMAVAAALDFYEELRAIEIPNAASYTRFIYGEGKEYDGAEIPRENKDFLQLMARQITLEDKARVAANFASERVNKYARGSICKTAERDPAKPRAALIPHAHACGYCLIIAANGFSYKNTTTLRAALHANCRCRVVVQFDPKERWYDFGKIYDLYKSVEQSPELADEIQRLWASKTEKEKREINERFGEPREFASYLKKNAISNMLSRMTQHNHS